MRMRANGEKILRLNTGNPAEFGFTAPDEVIHDLIMNARDSEGYSDSKGIFSARKAIMQYCQLKKFPNVDIDDIYLGNGVSELIVMSMQGLLDNGDEGLGCLCQTILSGQRLSAWLEEMPFTISVMKLQNGTQILTISSQKSLQYQGNRPYQSKQSNWSPYPKELLLEIIEIARQNDLIIFADEITTVWSWMDMYIRLWRAGTRCFLCQHEWSVKIPPYRWFPCGLDGLVWT